MTQIICYDLRFPEILRYPARKGAKIAFYVAQWPSSRLDHWLSLLKARAIENDIFIVACNSCEMMVTPIMLEIQLSLILMVKF